MLKPDLDPTSFIVIGRGLTRPEVNSIRARNPCSIQINVSPGLMCPQVAFDLQAGEMAKPWMPSEDPATPQWCEKSPEESPVRAPTFRMNLVSLLLV